MDCETKEQRPQRVQASWIPKEHIITEGYPIFPVHLVDCPPMAGQSAIQIYISRIVNESCREAVTGRRRVIGGPPRKAAPTIPIEKTASYDDVICSLGLFAPWVTRSAHDSLIAILDEYPRVPGTERLRMILDGIKVADCFACGAEFDIRGLHRCNISRRNHPVVVIDELLEAKCP